MREVLPLSTNAIRVPPRVPTKIGGKPKYGPLMLERLYVADAGTPNGALDWVINDIEVDGVSQLSVKDLPGALFSTRGIVAGGRHAASGIHFVGLDVIESESEVTITVTYVGPNPEGVPFFGSIVGRPPPQRQTVLAIATQHPSPNQSSTNAKPADWTGLKTTISARLDAPLKIEMLEIESGNDGADWIVHDIRVDGKSQFAQPGDMPGDMFSTKAIDSFVSFQPGKQVEIDVMYIGLEEEGLCFVGRFLGTVIRDDYDQPPPDVRAIVHASNDESGPEMVVVARCNWRSPYVRPSAP